MHTNGIQIPLHIKEKPMTEVIYEGNMCKFSQHQQFSFVIHSVDL